jgi:predicted nucleotidyltransferase
MSRRCKVRAAEALCDSIGKILEVYNSWMGLRDLKSIERAVTAFLRSRPEVQAAYIFGSLLTGRSRPDSDVDIAVLVSDKIMRRDHFRYRLELITSLMPILGRDDVDLILLNQAPPLLAHRVLKKGRLVFERSASTRVAFQVRTVNRYLDTLPMRNLYLTYLKKHAREGMIFG